VSTGLAALAASVRGFAASAHPALLFAVMIAVTLNTVGLAAHFLPMYFADAPRGPTSVPWLEGLWRWDSGWFARIATTGYWFDPSRQSPVAFYPLYPLLMRGFEAAIGSYFLGAILITMASGLALVVLLYHWTDERLGEPAARMAVWVLLLYPFSVFLYGAAYSDALFAAATILAFACLERDRPWLAGLAGAAATATRPVGLAVLIGLVVRACERRGVFGEPGRRALHLDRLRATDTGVLLSAAGMGLYWTYLWFAFGEPLAWIHAMSAPGWEVEPGPMAWFKVRLFSDILLGRWELTAIRMLHVPLCVLAYATLPSVWRRFGIGYAAYAFVVLSILAVSSPDFFGMGRYVLPAFPCFAIAGLYLLQRPRLARVALPASFAAQTAIAALWAAWYPLT
jgi:hypothetical protein